MRVDGELAMAVLPAACRIDFDRLEQLVGGSRRVEVVLDREFAARFLGCERGALPPFGNLYGMNVYAARSLSEAPTISFYAGTRMRIVEMAYGDYDRLVRPRVGEFACRTAT